MRTPERTLATLDEHSFSDIAAKRWAQEHPIAVQNLSSIGDVWKHIRGGETGVVPLHNSASFIGTVGDHLETLWQTQSRLVGEVRQTVQMCLGARNREAYEEMVRSQGEGYTLYSHPKAIQQSSEKLSELGRLRRVETLTTVGGAEAAARDAKGIALASRSALEQHGLLAVDPAMANLPGEHNKTTMGIVEGGKIQEFPDVSKQNHAFILIPENRPGVLNDITGILRDSCDLQKIDSFMVDPRHAGFFIPLRKREVVDDIRFPEAMLNLYNYPALRDSKFSSLNMLPSKLAKFDVARRRSIVCLGSWSDEDAIEN